MVKRAAWVVVSLLSLMAVAWWASRQHEPQMPTNARGALWLVAALAIYAAALALRGWRWHRILILSGIAHRRADAFGLTQVAYMGNTVLPARGGEMLRTTILKKRSAAGVPEIVGTLMAELLFGLVALGALFAALTWEGVAGAPTGRLAADIAGAATVATAAVVALCRVLRLGGRFEALAARVRPFVRASRLLARPEGIPLLGMSVLIWLLEGLTLLLVGNALALHLSVSKALLTAVVAALATSLPAGPGYAGSYDASVLLTLHASGIAGGSAVGFLLLARFVVFVPVTVVGAGLLLTRYGGLRLTGRWRQSSTRERHERMRLSLPLSVAGAATTDAAARNSEA